MLVERRRETPCLSMAMLKELQMMSKKRIMEISGKKQQDSIRWNVSRHWLVLS